MIQLNFNARKFSLLFGTLLILTISISSIEYFDYFKPPSFQVSVIDHETPKGYLFYIPHSGFVNQLIELSNALVISYLTKRTLILPPFYVGFLEIPFGGFYKQLENIQLVDTVVGGYCNSNNDEMSIISSKTKHDSIASIRDKRFIIPFDALFDSSALPSGVNVISIEHYLNITKKVSISLNLILELDRYGFRYAEKIPGATYLVDNLGNNLTVALENNQQPYDTNRFLSIYSDGSTRVELENSESLSPNLISKTPFGRFNHLVDLEKFSLLGDLVVLTSTFSEDRVLLEESNTIQQQIDDSLVFSNPILVSISDNIVTKLGKYLGVHLRGSDGPFKEHFNSTILHATKQIQSLWCSSEDESSSNCLVKPLRIFVATDIDPTIVKTIMKDELKRNVEIFLLHDFHEEISSKVAPLSSMIIRNGKGLSMRILESFLSYYPTEGNDVKCNNNKHDDTSSYPDDLLWLPFLDQLVASKGFAFMGTSGSSFSKRIERFHKIYNEDPWLLPSAK